MLRVWGRFGLSALFCLALSATVLPRAVAAATIYPGESLDASGIAVVGRIVHQFAPKSEQQAIAFDQALSLALKNPADMAYPWLDAGTNKLEVRARTATGLAVAQQRLKESAPGPIQQSVTAGANTSIAQLQQIADSVTRLNASGVPHADLIWKTEPDQEHNRIIITVKALDGDLMSTLASRFGTNLIAVRVDPIQRGPSADSRQYDSSPFWGGANVSPPGTNCTTGFSWKPTSTTRGMLTAAHCASSGGNVSNWYYSPTIWGTVASGSEENWSTTYGTQYYTGQTTYRGDVALIRIKSGYSSAAYIYTSDGAPGGYRIVGQMNSGRVQSGNPVCFSGNVTKYWCGMVIATGLNIPYGGNVWARNVVDAEAIGNTCPTQGDSGGPIYQWRSDGKAIAQGILTGSFPSILACDIYFTDIWDAYYGLPGVLLTA